MRRYSNIIVCVAILMHPRGLIAQEAAVESEPKPETALTSRTERWPGGTSKRGMLGIHRVELAVPRPTGSWLFNFTGAYSSADNFFGDGGKNERYRQSVGLTYVPLENLEIGVRQFTVSNRNGAVGTRPILALGDPTFSGKYSYFVNEQLRVGGLLSVMIPTSAGGSGFDASALVLDSSALVSYLVLPYFQTTLNVGYRLDNSAQLFDGTDNVVSPAQRFAGRISEMDLVTFGLGAETQFEVGPNIYLDPYVEFVGGLPLSGASGTKAPILASLGAKVMPFGASHLEFNVGADIRLSGAPDPILNALPGLPPWEVFSRIAYHITPAPPPALGAEAPVVTSVAASCPPQVECPESFEKPPEVFQLKGSVLHQNSRDPVGQAIVKISDQPLLAVDYKTGDFGPARLNTGEGLLEVVVEAPGFRTASQRIQRGKPGDTVELKFALQPSGDEAMGEIRGSLRDAQTGKPVAGSIFIPRLNRKLRVKRAGRFKATVAANRYHVLISSRGYVTQRKDVEIRAGDVVILNIDLAPRPR